MARTLIFRLFDMFLPYGRSRLTPFLLKNLVLDSRSRRRLQLRRTVKQSPIAG